jgi:hypothetical protein
MNLKDHIDMKKYKEKQIIDLKILPLLSNKK